MITEAAMRCPVCGDFIPNRPNALQEHSHTPVQDMDELDILDEEERP